MTAFGVYGDVHVELGADHVGVVEIRRPPNNFFDRPLIAQIAQALEALDDEVGCRVALLVSEGKHFCAGADFGNRSQLEDDSGRHLYDEAVRLFETRKPVVAAVQGAAVGGGLGLACFADFRVTSPESRFSANFARLGFHHGFGLTVTLPRLVGEQRALELLYTGRRISGEEAVRIGLCDREASKDDLRAEAHALAAEIAVSAPLAVESIRHTHRGDLAARIREATDHEKHEQDRLQKTSDFREGVAAMAARRVPDFHRE